MLVQDCTKDALNQNESEIIRICNLASCQISSAYSFLNPQLSYVRLKTLPARILEQTQEAADKYVLTCKLTLDSEVFHDPSNSQADQLRCSHERMALWMKTQ